MKKTEKAKYDRLVIDICAKAKKAFEKAGRSDSEDLSQEVALHLSAARLSEFKHGFEGNEVLYLGEKITQQVYRDAKSRESGAKLMDLEAASDVADVANPHHFLMANEIADAAVRLDLDSFMMGDTLEDEAHHYGVSRQRAHQIVNDCRKQMSEFLIS